MSKQHNNRDLIRNALYVFQKKTGITKINGKEKLTQAFTEFSRGKGLDFRFMDYRDAEKLIYSLLSSAAIQSASTDILAEWNEYTKTVIKR